eukprot:SAG22_NODE_244_length_14023_cov_45.200661_2_plen_103_part_00
MQIKKHDEIRGALPTYAASFLAPAPEGSAYHQKKKSCGCCCKPKPGMECADLGFRKQWQGLKDGFKATFPFISTAFRCDHTYILFGQRNSFVSFASAAFRPF